MLLVDEELECIERTVRRVEAANEESVYGGGTTGVLLSSGGGDVTGKGPTPLEFVRAPRAHVMVELIQQFADLSQVRTNTCVCVCVCVCVCDVTTNIFFCLQISCLR